MNVEKDTKHTFPMHKVEKLASSARWLSQNPRKILQYLIQPGMTVMDFGCGPGFFTVTMLNMVGESGRVIAVDYQHEMLDILKSRVDTIGFAHRIKYYKCESGKIGIKDQLDFMLAFYVVHEVDSKDEFFKEARSLMKPNSYILLAEPIRRVSYETFDETLESAYNAGFELVCEPIIKKSWTALLRPA